MLSVCEHVVINTATSPALFYPGYRGGGIFYHNKLLCRRQICSPGWRSSCGSGKLGDCRKKFCRHQTATEGAVCDISPCVQGNCYGGKCMGKGAATCPSAPDDCKKYRCSQRSGQCREICPKPNGSPCKNGTGSCESGVCIPTTPPCPQDPNKCQKYVYDPYSKQCNLENTTCTQPPGVKYSCKTVLAALAWLANPRRHLL
ncbi:hypothetical protein COO60DRAFT_1641158 [Scenedesmus sp. NREL 46B-D3]|nr:hypothetical protein COO60DRAFT_1641158 [Scenedesmus sp. NREL 46B-D3]